MDNTYEDSDYEQPVWLPFWAECLADGKVGLYSQLCTKDGNRMGNAVVVGVDLVSIYNEEFNNFKVVTDAGSSFIMCEDEVLEIFHPPKYIMSKEHVDGRYV